MTRYGTVIGASEAARKETREVLRIFNLDIASYSWVMALALIFATPILAAICCGRLPEAKLCPAKERTEA